MFQIGEFKLHSGNVSRWKIECDDLTDGDIEAVALMLSERLPKFRRGVIGVPLGGFRLAAAMDQYGSDDPGLPVLIVDDVLTTGRSMEECHLNGAIGAVIFARGKCPNWVYPLFEMRR